MNFGKYIHELLLENDIVIVPGFGAFVTEYKPAEIDHGSGEMKPPAKMVSFNPQIRNNDGLLVGYVSEKQRVSHFEALKRIEKERENILYNLDSGKKVELSEVGSLFYTEENTIGFEAVENENLLLDSFGLEVTAVEPQEEAKQTKEQVVPVQELEEKEPELPPKAPVEKKAEAPQAPEPIIEKAAPVYVSAEENKKKKKGWLWLLLILVPLLIVSVYIILNDKEVPGADKGEDPVASEPITEKPEEIAQDTFGTQTDAQDSSATASTDTSIAEEIIPEKELVPEPEGPKYYLVSGSFAIEENAEIYLKELQDKGVDAFYVGKKGRFFIVGIGTYDSFNQAEKAKKEYMRNNPDSEVWVYKK